jgi:hypothetical protein
MTAHTDLERVREAYPDTEELSAARLASMRARLVEFIDTSATAQPHQRRWRVARRRWRVAAAVGAAAAVAGVIVASGVLRGGAQNPDVAAAATLERYAQTISRETWHPLNPGQWLYFRKLGNYPGNYGHHGPAGGRATDIEQFWLAANGAARIVQHPGVVGGGDVLLLDQPRREILAEQERQRGGSHLRVMAYPQRYYWGAGPDYQQLIRLPTDPAKLRGWIERRANIPGSTCARGVSTCHIFSFVESLLIAGPLPPKLSAALYRVIADLPGMRLIGPTRDPLGRPGVAIGYFFTHQPGRAELIFDPTTGVFLAERGISLNSKIMHAPVGSVTDWTAIVDQGVAQSDREIPSSNNPVPHW